MQMCILQPFIMIDQLLYTNQSECLLQIFIFIDHFTLKATYKLCYTPFPAGVGRPSSCGILTSCL